jgi:hypothetical protein
MYTSGYRYRAAAPADVKPRDPWFWVLSTLTGVVVALGVLLGGGALPRIALPPAAIPPSLASDGQRAWEAILASLPGARGCRIVLGFGMLERLVGRAVAGECLEDERFDPEWGVAIQTTTNGLFVFRRSDGTLAYTDGYRTWLLGPTGFQRRLNTQRLCWEPDADPRTCLRG